MSLHAAALRFLFTALKRPKVVTVGQRSCAQARSRMTWFTIDDAEEPESPDLNPTEHIQKALERCLYASPLCPSQVSDLTSDLMAESA